MKRFAILILLLGMLAPLAPRPAAALESAPVSSPRATASLVTDTDAVTAGTPFRVGLRLRLAPGWHTYWQNPGDAGVPAELTFDLPPGATASAIDWPTPRRVAEGPVMTYAYTGDVLLPVTVTARGRRSVPARGACRLAGLQGHLRAGGRRLPARPAGRHAGARPPRRRCSPRMTARCRGRRRGSRVIAPDGTLFVQGPELNPATVVDAWFIPRAPAGSRTTRRSRCRCARAASRWR